MQLLMDIGRWSLRNQNPDSLRTDTPLEHWPSGCVPLDLPGCSHVQTPVSADTEDDPGPWACTHPDGSCPPCGVLPQILDLKTRRNGSP